MADLIVNKTEQPNSPVAVTLNSLTADTEADFDCSFKDEHTMFIATVTTASTSLTLKAGNSYAGVNDEVMLFDAAGTYAFTINSNRFKNVSGEKGGKVTVVADKAMTLGIVEARV